MRKKHAVGSLEPSVVEPQTPPFSFNKYNLTKIALAAVGRRLDDNILIAPCSLGCEVSPLFVVAVIGIVAEKVIPFQHL